MRSLNDIFITGHIPDVSTADQVYMPCPDDGVIVGLYATISAAITVADATLTIKTAQGTVSDTLTIANSGSAAGSTFYTDITPSEEGTVLDAGYIEVETDGGSTTTSECIVTVVVRR